MAFSAKAGSFACPTTTNATYGITGVGFQPKALLLFWNDLTSDSNTVNTTIQGIGMAVSTTQRAAIVFADNYTGAGTRCRYDNAKCVSFITGAAGITMEADFVSFDADGFTLNFSTVDGTAKIVNYLALGGSDLTNAAVKQFTMPNATGNQATTGVGFQPDAMVLMTAYGDSIAAPRTMNTTVFWQGIGFATNSTHRGTSAAGVGSGTHYGDYERTAKCIAVTADGTTGGVIAEADFVSMDADGFTLNWTTVSAQTSVPVFALCLKGGSYFVGSDTQKTSTGTKATTGVGFQPSAAVFSTVMRAAGTTVNDGGNIQLGIGAASSTTARGTISYVDGATNSSTVLDRTLVLKMITDGSPPTVNAAADLSSFDADGFTLNWSAADATAREFVFLAVGATAVAATPFIGQENGPYPFSKARERGSVQSIARNLIGKDQFFGAAGEVKVFDYPNPRIKPHPIEARTFIGPDHTKFAGQDKFFGPAGLGPDYDWPNPVLRAWRKDLRGWFVNLQQTTLAPAVSGKPFNSNIFFNPRGYPFPLELRTGLSWFVIDDTAPFAQFYWPNPILRVRRANALTWLVSLNETTLASSAGFKPIWAIGCNVIIGGGHAV